MFVFEFLNSDLITCHNLVYANILKNAGCQIDLRQYADNEYNNCNA
jgi:hypothetical protein